MEITTNKSASKELSGVQSSRILIAGGYGMVGSTIARHVRKLYPDVALVLTGRNPEKGSDLAEELGNTEVLRLDIHQEIDWHSIGQVDLIIASMHDHGDRLIQYALTHGIAHIGITKMADEIAPIMFSALLQPPQKPIAILGHWQAGVLTTVAKSLAEQFSKIHTVEMLGLFDPLDPIGPMVAEEVGEFIGRALLREQGTWKWVNATEAGRAFHLSEDSTLEAYPMATLDVPSLAAITLADDIRFDFVQGNSLGTLAGGTPSHDLYIDMEGVLKDGKESKKRVIISDPQGNAHLTALGVLVAIERILGLDGLPQAKGGIHTPETLLVADQAIQRFKQFGVNITFLA